MQDANEFLLRLLDTIKDESFVHCSAAKDLRSRHIGREHWITAEVIGG